MMSDGNMMGNMMGWMWLGGLFWLVLVAGGIALVVWAIARGSSGGRQAIPAGDDRARAILRERFARGELSEPEYRQMRQALDSES